ncbi:hypothetical protein HNQ93_004024 [Hymenobacter luteus]|uniref:Uncharacterized protein n=2 Tax=Hymenobacter TaxID=89966 RepID=A0A7W9WE69_9BACT|nr:MULTISPECIES: hypothetical protein [Hymenobacter]MBB4603296.1 hypothetical protein [Hymenobacter latericoloratus]MBB6061146.1 hypothetical protein [Hymenobacter luteus]
MKNLALTVALGCLAVGAAFLALPPRRRGDADRNKGLKKPFDPQAGNPVSEAQAAECAKKYKKKYKDNTSSNYCAQGPIRQLLNQPGCVGIRIYRSLNPDDDRHGIVLVGVNEQGYDLLPGKQQGMAYRLMESYEKCPYNCDGNTLTK